MRRFGGTGALSKRIANESTAASATPAFATRAGSYAGRAFLVVHVVAGTFALLTLRHAWDHKFLPILFGAARMRLILLCIALVVLLAFAEAGRTLVRIRRRQPERNVATRLRSLFFAAVASLFVDVFVLEVRFAVSAEISLTFAYGAYALWALLLPWLQRVLPDGLRRGVDLVCTNAAVTLVVVEIALRIAAMVWPTPLLVTTSMPEHIRRVADRKRPGTLQWGFPMNQGGHYDTEFQRRSHERGQVVASIGDSFSYGLVPHPLHFTSVAERELRGVEVYNLGYPGIGPRDYLHLLQHEALAFDPDLVVIQLFMGNDLTDTPNFGDPPRWYTADSYLVSIVWHRLGLVRREGGIGSITLTERTVATVDQLLAQYPHLADPFLEQPHFSKDLFLQIEADRAEAMARSNQHVYRVFFEALADLERAASDVPLAFVLIPDELQVEDAVWDEVRRRTGPLDRDRPQREIVEWCERREVPVLDLLPVLRAVDPLEDGRRHLYHLQDTHFNTRGNEVAGRALAGFVQSLLPAPPPLSPLRADSGPLAAAGPRELRYRGRASDRIAVRGSLTLRFSVDGSEDVVKAVRQSDAVLSIDELRVEGEGERTIVAADGDAIGVQVAFDRGRVDVAAEQGRFQIDFDRARSVESPGRDPVRQLAWSLAMGERQYRLGRKGEYEPSDGAADAQGEALGLIMDAIVRLPDHPVAVGDQWTIEWTGTRREPDTGGVFDYLQTARLEEIAAGESPRARITFRTTGSLAIPPARNQDRGEATRLEVKGTIVLDLATGQVVASDTAGTITSRFSAAGFTLRREVEARSEERAATAPVS